MFYFAVPPLFVIEFLHRVVDTFEDYFSECTESIIKEHYVVVYEVRITNLNTVISPSSVFTVLNELCAMKGIKFS